MVTQAFGINNSGQIVGTFDDAPGGKDMASWIRAASLPRSISRELTGTYAYGINDSGQIVGVFFDSTIGAHGFLDTGGIFTAINVPGLDETDAYGINDSGGVAMLL